MTELFAVVYPMDAVVPTTSTVFVNDKVKICTGGPRKTFYEAKFDTGIQLPTDTYEMYDSERKTIVHEQDLKLQTFKSSLTMAIRELVAKKGVYPKLLHEFDHFRTTRRYVYQLYFGELPLYFSHSDYVDRFNQFLTNPEGILVLHRDSLVASVASRFETTVPTWYLQGTILDHHHQLPMRLVKTDDDYYFFSDVLFMTEDLNSVYDQMRTMVTQQMSQGVFPSNTPEEVVKSRFCIPLGNQWITTMPVDSYLYDSYLVDVMVFNQRNAFYTFLYHLHKFPTGAWLTQEIKVITSGGNLIVSLRTNYPPDYLRFRQAKGINAFDVDVQISITQPSSGAAVSYTDAVSGNQFWLWADGVPDLDVFNGSLTLENRLMADDKVWYLH